MKFLFKDVASGDTDDGDRSSFNLQMAVLVGEYKGCWFCMCD